MIMLESTRSRRYITKTKSLSVGLLGDGSIGAVDVTDRSGSSIVGTISDVKSFHQSDYEAKLAAYADE